MTRFFCLIVGVIFGFQSFAQFKVPQISTWRVHLPYQTNHSVAQNGSIIYLGSSSGVFSYDADEGGVEVMSRVTGLSDVEVSKLAYDDVTETLIIIYKNTNVDLIANGRVYNIPGIFMQSIIGDKLINDVCVFNGIAYLACSFGIVKIDLKTRQIVDSYQNIGEGGSNLIINDLAVFNGSLYASSPGGLYRASLNSGNLSDFKFWSKSRTDSISHLLTVGGYLLAATYQKDANKVLRYDGIVWDSLTGLSNTVIRNVRVTRQKLMVIQEDRAVVYNAQLAPATTKMLLAAMDGVLNMKDEFSMAIAEQGLVIFEQNRINYIAPQGPWGRTAAKFAYSASRKQLYVSSGYVDGFGGASGWKNTYNNNKYYVFDGNSWQNGYQLNNELVNRCQDVLDVAVDDRTNKTYFTSFGSGVLELTGTSPTKLYDTSNSKLDFFVNEFPNYRPVFAAGTTVDENGNLWVTCYGAAKPLAVKTPSNQWYNFSFNGGNNSVGYIVCDNNFPRNNKWIINNRGSGLYVYNEGSNISSSSDDLFAVLTSEKGKGNLPSKNVLCMALDLNGEMWVGTDQGLCIISDPTAVFSTDTRRSYDARQLVFNTGSFNSIFLGTDAIYSIKVDGANRKWIATRNGVWLVSEDGYTVIRNFTTSNSPLLSNVVYDIGIFEETGEVFFATEKGIISYAGDATRADEKHGNVVVYPNPVRPDFTGDVAIRGLANETNVKITDIAGNLVYETKANGGMATWNGRTFSGKRAATGVYLIYSSNDDATETYVTKLLFIN